MMLPESILGILDRVFAPESAPGLLVGLCLITILAPYVVDLIFTAKEEPLPDYDPMDDIPDDTCMCGDPMENHSSPLNCGHSPVSMRAYYLRDEK